MPKPPQSTTPHHLSHTLNPQKTTSPHFVSYFSEKHHTSISPSCALLFSGCAYPQPSLFMSQFQLSTHSGHNKSLYSCGTMHCEGECKFWWRPATEEKRGTTLGEIGWSWTGQSSYRREGTAWRWFVSRQEANAAHRGSLTRWSRTSGFGGEVEQRRSRSTADDQAGSSIFRTSHCCRNRVETMWKRAREWAVHCESTNDARREYDAGRRNRLVKVQWCGPTLTVLGLGMDQDSAWQYQAQVRPRCWRRPQCHVSRVVPECQTIDTLSCLGSCTICLTTSNSWLLRWLCWRGLPAPTGRNLRGGFHQHIGIP
jgi:hypothetical protein